MLDFYIASLRSNHSILPLITDRWTAEDIICRYLGTPVNLLTLMTGDQQDLFIYRKDEEKKSFPIEQVRKCIDDSSSIPYSGRSIAILDGIDTASINAMNALLKFLEEPPVYLAILLIVENPEGLLETIRSRCITLHKSKRQSDITNEEQAIIDAYKAGNRLPLIEYIYRGNYTREEALFLMNRLIPYAKSRDLKQIETIISLLYESHETPKYIMDLLFFGNNDILT